MELPRRHLWPVRPPGEFVVGLDLGQRQDYTALCVLERLKHVTTQGGEVAITYDLRHLHRWSLGTPYPEIVQETAALLDRAPLSRADTTLVIDRTGVGAVVADLFVEAGLEPYGVVLHGGTTIAREGTGARVPKRDAVHVLVTLLQTGRLHMAAGMPLLDVLQRELAAFRVSVSLKGHDTYESWRQNDHDDLVLSVAMGAWFAVYELSRRDGFDDEATGRMVDYLADRYQPWAEGTPRWGREEG
jgi:hypothetical protein